MHSVSETLASLLRFARFTTVLRAWYILKVITIPLRYASGIIRLTLRAALRLLSAWLIKK
jgi:hypothetical protein